MATAVTATKPPPQVSGLVATTFLYSTVTVSWVATAGAVSYQLQYRERGTASWTNGPLIAAPTTHANLTGLKTGTTYDFRAYANGV